MKIVSFLLSNAQSIQPRRWGHQGDINHQIRMRSSRLLSCFVVGTNEVWWQMKEERMNSWQWAKHAELYSDYSGLRLRISEERRQSYVLTTSGFICGFLKRVDKAIFLPRVSSVDFWRERTKLYSDYSGLHLWIFEERGQGYILTTPGFNCGFLKREDLRFCTRGAPWQKVNSDWLIHYL